MIAFWIALAAILVVVAVLVIRQRKAKAAQQETRDARLARERAAKPTNLPDGMTPVTPAADPKRGRLYDTLDEDREARERARYRAADSTVTYDDGGIGDLATIAAIEAMANQQDQDQSSAAEPPPVPDIPVTDPTPSYDSGYSDSGSSSSDSGSSSGSDGGGGGGGD